MVTSSTARKNRMKMLSHMAAAKRKANAEIRNRQAVEVEGSEIEAPEVQEVDNPEAINMMSSLSWNKKAEDSLKRYSRGLEYSARHIRRLNKKSKEAAKGTLAITSFFKPTMPIEEVISQEEKSDAKEEFMLKAKKALSELMDFSLPIVNAKSKQQQLGVAEFSKYEGVFHYLCAIVNGNMKKMEASKHATFLIHKNKTSDHKARNIRRHTKEYLENGGVIALGTQGKHSKRVSVLDDADIKRKVIEWFRSVPRAKRSVPGV